jgi:hypothetical protein
MKKLSFRPSPAMVVACVALFVALGGTGLAATYVVSSNSQVGPNTISGHNPPSGKHANVISGSINGTDLAPNSVNGGKVANGSLSAADTNTNSIQRRVTGACPSGQAAQSVSQTGALACGATDGGAPGGSAGGGLSGTYPNPEIANDAIGVPQLSSANGSSSVEAIPFVLHLSADTGLLSPSSGVDRVIYNANAPREFKVVAAWASSTGSNTIQWQLQEGGASGNALTDLQSIPTPSGQIASVSGNIRPATVFQNDSLSVHFDNEGLSDAGAHLDLYVLAVPLS